MPDSCIRKLPGFLFRRGRRRYFETQDSVFKLRKSVERLRHHIRGALIIADFYQFRKVQMIDSTQLREKFCLCVSLLAHKQKYSNILLRRNLAGKKDFNPMVLREIEKLIPLVKTHTLSPFSSIMSHCRQPFNQAATNSMNFNG